MSLAPYSAAEFRRRAIEQTLTLGEESWRDHGDSLLNPGVIPHLEDMKLRDAAVLIPVVDDGEEARSRSAGCRSTRRFPASRSRRCWR